MLLSSPLGLDGEGQAWGNRWERARGLSVPLWTRSMIDAMGGDA